MSIPDDNRDPWPPRDLGAQHDTEHHTEPPSDQHAGPQDPPAAPRPASYRPGPWQAPYGYGQQQPAASMSPDSERNWAIASHLTGFVAAYAALGFLGPLVCMLLIGDRSPFARRHAVEALNFNLTWLIYIVVAWVLTLVLVGWVLLAALGVGYLVLVVRGAMAASRGEEYRYPMTLRFVS
ncbi:MAG: DUF4870 domain-containing protein [Actinomycetes bacterium]